MHHDWIRITSDNYEGEAEKEYVDNYVHFYRCLGCGQRSTIWEMRLMLDFPDYWECSDGN